MNPLFTTARQIATCEQEQILKFIEDINENKLKLKIQMDNLTDIKDAVSEMIGNITDIIEKEEPKYAISKFYFVGSMAEGTRNSAPTECDFLLVLKHLSVPGAIGIERVRHMDPYSGLDYDHAHITVKESNVRQMFAGSIDEDGFLHDPCSEESSTFKQVFEKCLHILEREKPVSVVTNSGTLGFLQSKWDDTKSDCNGPAFTFSLIWDSKYPTEEVKFSYSIDVDCSPAIEVEHIDPVVTLDDFAAIRYFSALQEEGKFLLVPARTCENSKCFKFTFTNTEVRLVREMSDMHKLCQRVLKLWCGKFRIELYDGNGFPAKAFSSYHIKTCILTHAVACTNTNVFHCILDVLSMLSENYVRKENEKYLYSDLKCIFMKSNSVSTRCFEKDEKERIDDFLTSIVNCLVEIGQTVEYDFKTAFLSLEHATAAREDFLPLHLLKV